MGNLSDKEIKDLFQNREITPSEASWDKLENMLETESATQGKGFKYWIGIAASIAVVGLLMWWVIPQGEGHNNKIIVQSEIPYEIKEEENNVVSNTVSSDTVTSIETITSFGTKVAEGQNPILDEVYVSEKEVITQISSRVKDDIEILEGTTYEPIMALIEEVSEVQEVGSKNVSETENLLNKAHERLKKERLAKIKKKHKTHPDLLLAEAEKKSQETLLAKLQKNVQSTSEQVIVAVINRIYE